MYCFQRQERNRMKNKNENKNTRFWRGTSMQWFGWLFARSVRDSWMILRQIWWRYLSMFSARNSLDQTSWHTNDRQTRNTGTHCTNPNLKFFFCELLNCLQLTRTPWTESEWRENLTISHIYTRASAVDLAARKINKNARHSVRCLMFVDISVMLLLCLWVNYWREINALNGVSGVSVLRVHYGNA